MRQKHVSKSMHVEAALFGEDIESILKLILQFAILAKPNQQNKSVNNHNKNTSKLWFILGNPGLQRGWDGKGETRSGKKVGGGEGKRKGKFPFPSPLLISGSQSLPSLPIPFEALGFREWLWLLKFLTSNVLH